LAARRALAPPPSLTDGGPQENRGVDVEKQPNYE
jgi:hypothetical protein